MDNYKYAKVFERLAIKIVETQYNFQLDYKRTHMTQATRDYGIDSVIYFSDRTIQCSTIEAKLRKSDYTLSLKDIASSILFFLVRKGDEHFIVSNVYITSGTIDVIDLLNLQSTSKIHYISGAETKNVLEKLIKKISDSEEHELAQYLIDNFESLKKPYLKESNFYIHSKEDAPFFLDTPELLISRRNVCQHLLESIKQPYKFIIMRGDLGIGKKTVIQHFNQSLRLSQYKIVTIDAFINNTLDVFCCELTRKFMGLDLQNVLSLLSSKDIQDLKDNLNDREIESLDNIQTILGDEELSNNAAIYLAKLYLQTLLQKCDKLKYIIEIENFSYTSKEVFELIRDLIIELPSNICILLVFTTDYAAPFKDFSNQYKQLYESWIQTIEIAGFSPAESEQYIKSYLPNINSEICKKIHEFTQGTPVLINKVIRVLEKEVFINPVTVSKSLKSITILDERGLKNTFENDNFALTFFFVLYLYSFKLEKSIWEKLRRILNLNDYDLDKFKRIYFENLQLLTEAEHYYVLKYSYMSTYIEKYFEDNEIVAQNYLKILKDNDLSCQVFAITQIRLLYYCRDSKILDVYEKHKISWKYKNNIEWKTAALKYICKYYRYTSSENIKIIINASNYYLDYLNIVDIYDFFEQNILSQVEENVNLLEGGFSFIEESYKNEAADVIAKYYIYKYQFYRNQSDFTYAVKILEDLLYIPTV